MVGLRLFCKDEADAEMNFKEAENELAEPVPWPSEKPEQGMLHTTGEIKNPWS